MLRVFQTSKTATSSESRFAQTGIEERTCSRVEQRRSKWQPDLCQLLHAFSWLRISRHARRRPFRLPGSWPKATAEPLPWLTSFSAIRILGRTKRSLVRRRTSPPSPKSRWYSSWRTIYFGERSQSSTVVLSKKRLQPWLQKKNLTESLSARTDVRVWASSCSARWRSASSIRRRARWSRFPAKRVLPHAWEQS